jgi:TolA-binding protein
MKTKDKLLRGAALALLMTGMTGIALMPTVPPVFAAEADDAIDSSEFSRNFVGHYVDAVEAFQDDMDFPAAHGFLDEALAIDDLTPQERYTAEILHFQLYLQEQNIEAATPHINNAYDTGVMPQADKENYLRIATLVNQQDYPRAIMYGAEAQNYPGWDDSGDQVLANAYYFSGDLAGAEQFAESVVARKDAVGEPVPFAILNVLYFAEQEQGKEAEAALTAGRIAVVQPTPENWARVIDNAFGAPNLDDRQFMNLYRLRLKTGSLDPSEYAGMTNLAINLGLPSEAQAILDEGISAGYLQAADVAEATQDVAALTAETEAALDGFAAEAAAAPTGEVHVQYGELLLGYGRYAEAETEIQAGLQKGGLTSVADAQILLGIAQLEQGKKAEAEQTFMSAEQDPVSGAVAYVWRLYASV